MPVLLDLGRLGRLRGLHQRLHGVNLIKKRKAPPRWQRPWARLFAGERKKVKEKRAFAAG
jgi:hypothetical protein